MSDGSHTRDDVLGDFLHMLAAIDTLDGLRGLRVTCELGRLEDGDMSLVMPYFIEMIDLVGKVRFGSQWIKALPRASLARQVH